MLVSYMFLNEMKRIFCHNTVSINIKSKFKTSGKITFYPSWTEGDTYIEIR